MGEADAARMLVEVGRCRCLYAAHDPGGGAGRARHRRSFRPLPLGRAGARRCATPVWVLTSAMCAALEGEAARASALVDQARGSGAGRHRSHARRKGDRRGRRDAARCGGGMGRGRCAQPLAARPGRRDRRGDSRASARRGRAAPARLVCARCDGRRRRRGLDAAATAAALGVFSSSALVELHSLIFDRADPAEVGADDRGAPAQRLGGAGGSGADRRDAPPVGGAARSAAALRAG